MRAVTSTYTSTERREIAEQQRADAQDQADGFRPAKAEARTRALNSAAEINLASDSPAGRVEVAS